MKRFGEGWLTGLGAEHRASTRRRITAALLVFFCTIPPETISKTLCIVQRPSTVPRQAHNSCDGLRSPAPSFALLWSYVWSVYFSLCAVRYARNQEDVADTSRKEMHRECQASRCRGQAKRCRGNVREADVAAMSSKQVLQKFQGQRCSDSVKQEGVAET